MQPQDGGQRLSLGRLRRFGLDPDHLPSVATECYRPANGALTPREQSHEYLTACSGAVRRSVDDDRRGR